jgi:hypothetical protein
VYLDHSPAKLTLVTHTPDHLHHIGGMGRGERFGTGRGDTRIQVVRVCRYHVTTLSEDRYTLAPPPGRVWRARGGRRIRQPPSRVVTRPPVFPSAVGVATDVHRRSAHSPREAVADSKAMSRVGTGARVAVAGARRLPRGRPVRLQRRTGRRRGNPLRPWRRRRRRRSSVCSASRSLRSNLGPALKAGGTIESGSDRRGSLGICREFPSEDRTSLSGCEHASGTNIPCLGLRPKTRPSPRCRTVVVPGVSRGRPESVQNPAVENDTEDCVNTLCQFVRLRTRRIVGREAVKTKQE